VRPAPPRGDRRSGPEWCPRLTPLRWPRGGSSPGRRPPPDRPQGRRSMHLAYDRIDPRLRLVLSRRSVRETHVILRRHRRLGIFRGRSRTVREPAAPLQHPSTAYGRGWSSPSGSTRSPTPGPGPGAIACPVLPTDPLQNPSTTLTVPFPVSTSAVSWRPSPMEHAAPSLAPSAVRAVTR
jgi:hypothetical protein